MKNRFGFTLSEVVVVLGIIGLIVVMTTPKLITDFRKRGYVASLQTFTNDFAEAVDMYLTENNKNNLKHTNLYTNFTSEMPSFARNYFKVSKSCAKGNTNACFANQYKAISTSEKKSASALCDGFSYILPNSASLCMKPANTSEIAFVVLLDVNGPALPNIGGRDMFMFYLKENGQIYDDKDKTECGQNASGAGCYNKILNDKWKMNY